MAEFLLLMHDDAAGDGDWPSYLASLRERGRLLGGSAMGAGACVRKSGVSTEVTRHLTGYVKIEADDLAHAQTFLVGNPVYENDGTVKIRELPQS